MRFDLPLGSLRTCRVVMAVLLASMWLSMVHADAQHAGALSYDVDLVTDDATIVNGKANTSFTLQSQIPGSGVWTNILTIGGAPFSGTADNNGNWSGSCGNWLPNAGKHPDHRRVRILWANGTTSPVVQPTSFRAHICLLDRNAPLIAVPLGVDQNVEVEFTFLQNPLRFDGNPPADPNWFLDEAVVLIVLAEPFTWNAVDVGPTNPGDLQVVGFNIVAQDPHVLEIFLGPNTRQDQFAGLKITAEVNYDGGGAPGIFGDSATLLADVDSQAGQIQAATSFSLFEAQLCNPADLDGNGVIDSADLAGLLGNWGDCQE